MDFNEYADLAEIGYESREPVKPEDEFFHSVYIAGQSRKNHTGVTERAGELQIRGVEYNREEVNMIITHVKPVLLNEKSTPNGMKTECFSYKNGNPPWKGTCGLICGVTSAERASHDFCKNCKAQIIVSGIYCDDNGTPILDKSKPIFLFIRGKGMKYAGVSDYLSKLYKMDLEPVFQPVTEKSKAFEKSVVNNKRFVTKITVGEAPSNFGMKTIFVFNEGADINNNSLKDVLNITKKTKEKFDEKMDWSKRMSCSSAPKDEQKEPEQKEQQKSNDQTKQNDPSQGSFLSFNDIDLD